MHLNLSNDSTLQTPRLREHTLPSHPCASVMGEAAEPVPSLTRAVTPPLDQKTLNANRTEIIVLAIGILFLVSQLILMIWLFAPRAFVRRPREQRLIGWRPMDPDPDPDPVAQEPILSDELDSRPTRCPNYRRRSTWNGPSIAAFHERHPMRRRKSSSLKPADPYAFSSSDQDSDSSDHDSSVRKGLRDAGLAAALFAIPRVPLSPRRLRSPLSSPEPASEPESSKGSVSERGVLPATFSPRSPRMGPMNRLTISALFNAKIHRPGTTPMDSPVMDEKDLANIF